jgi:hypothetical protein
MQAVPAIRRASEADLPIAKMTMQLEAARQLTYAAAARPKRVIGRGS